MCSGKILINIPKICNPKVHCLGLEFGQYFILKLNICVLVLNIVDSSKKRILYDIWACIHLFKDINNHWWQGIFGSKNESCQKMRGSSGSIFKTQNSAISTRFLHKSDPQTLGFERQRRKRSRLFECFENLALKSTNNFRDDSPGSDRKRVFLSNWA